MNECGSERVSARTTDLLEEEGYMLKGRREVGEWKMKLASKREDGERETGDRIHIHISREGPCRYWTPAKT